MLIESFLFNGIVCVAWLFKFGRIFKSENCKTKIQLVLCCCCSRFQFWLSASIAPKKLDAVRLFTNSLGVVLGFIYLYESFWLEGFWFSWFHLFGFCFVLDHLRACLENSSINSSRSLFLGILPTNSRWLLNDIVTPIFLPFRISKSFSCNCSKVHTKQKKILICYEKFVSIGTAIFGISISFFLVKVKSYGCFVGVSVYVCICV